jgi:hypothetical protein
MSVNESRLREIALAFKASIAADLYTAKDIIDFEQAARKVDTYQEEISEIESLIDGDNLTVSGLASALIKFPRLYQVLCALLSINSNIQFEDGRMLSSPLIPPKTVDAASATADILIELGISKLLASPVNIKKLFLTVQIALDAPQRRARVDSKIGARIKHAINAAICDLNSYSKEVYSLVSSSSLPSSAKRIVEYVIAINGIPRIAVAATFQTYSGGRQNREISSMFPTVAANLASSGVTLLLIADGQGTKSLSEKILVELFRSVPHTMSISQAERGGLLHAIKEVLSAPLPLTADSIALDTIVETTLERNSSIAATSLPVPAENARLALANYAASNRHLKLELEPEAKSLAWTNQEQVSAFQQLSRQFDGLIACQTIVTLLNGEIRSTPPQHQDFYSFQVNIPDDPVITAPFLLAAYEGTVNTSILRQVARHALQNAQSSKLAILLTSGTVTETALRELRSAQNLLPVTVIAVDLATCLSMAKMAELPRERLLALLLEQSDLTKLSPFVVRGVTPARVFYGREVEEATLLSTLTSNSVALLGGRRIGKTSLMRHSFGRLEAADLHPVFGDCQVVRTWADFGAMASRQWKLDLPKPFRPHELFGLVEQLTSRAGKSVVILLDEVDQLLDWDKKHTEDEVPEAFFRACRAISQQGLAQFVFSGERIIANSIWDAASPHWNFCRPLALRQLSRKASEALISEPLEELGIRIEQRDRFVEACWENTNGHPELLQLIGDKIVGRLNGRDRRDLFVAEIDVQEITNDFDYAEQYLETYWGQATSMERILSILLVGEGKSIDRLSADLSSVVEITGGISIPAAMRMLELYGIARQTHSGYELCASWFPTALDFYGGPSAAIDMYRRMN